MAKSDLGMAIERAVLCCVLVCQGRARLSGLDRAKGKEKLRERDEFQCCVWWTCKPKQREVLGDHLSAPAHSGYSGRLKVGLLVHNARAQIIDASSEVRHTLDPMDPPGLLCLVYLSWKELGDF